MLIFLLSVELSYGIFIECKAIVVDILKKSQHNLKIINANGRYNFLGLEVKDTFCILLKSGLASYFFDAGGEYDAALCRGTSRSFNVLSSD